MPSLDFDPGALDDFKALPEILRRDAAIAIVTLLADPRPAAARPYADIPDAFRLETSHIVVYYRIVGADIDVLRIRPNS
jgi:hypothetical protein